VGSGWARLPGYFLSQHPQRTPGWHAHRRGRLTASTAGKTSGLSPYDHSREAKMKLARQILGLEPPLVPNAAMVYGNDGEAPLRRWFEERLALAGRRKVVIREAGLAVPDTATWVGASCDGEIWRAAGTWSDSEMTSNEIVEFKRPRKMYPELLERQQRGALTGPKIRVDHYAQMQLTAYITRKEYVWYVVAPGEGKDLSVKLCYTERLPLDVAFVEDELLPGMRSFYVEFMLPLITADPLLLRESILPHDNDDRTIKEEEEQSS